MANTNDNEQPCTVCGRVVPESILCDSCSRWWCIHCINARGVPGELTDELYEGLRSAGEEFAWDCIDCNPLTLTQQLILVGRFIPTDILDTYNCNPLSLRVRLRATTHFDSDVVDPVRQCDQFTSPRGSVSATVLKERRQADLNRELLAVPNPNADPRVSAIANRARSGSGLYSQNLPTSAAPATQDSQLLRTLAAVHDGQQAMLREHQRMLIDYQERQDQERRSEFRTLMQVLQGIPNNSQVQGPGTALLQMSQEYPIPAIPNPASTNPVVGGQFQSAQSSAPVFNTYPQYSLPVMPASYPGPVSPNQGTLIDPTNAVSTPQPVVWTTAHAIDTTADPPFSQVFVQSSGVTYPYQSNTSSMSYCLPTYTIPAHLPETSTNVVPAPQTSRSFSGSMNSAAANHTQETTTNHGPYSGHQERRAAGAGYNQVDAVRFLTSDPQPSQQASLYAKLPKLSLPTFSGNALDWPNFWESYEINIHTNPHLREKQKMDCLRELLKGTAFDKIKGLGLDGQHYREAVRILKSEYGEVRHLIKANWAALRDLPFVKYNLSNLEKFTDELRAITASLRRMGVIEEALDSQVNVLTEKLPHTLRAEMHKIRIIQGKKAIPWSMEDIVSLLLDLKELPPPLPGIKKDKEPLQGRNYSHTTQRLPSASALLQSVTGTLKCVFCTDSGHYSDSCTSVPDTLTRRQIAKRKGLCFNCLSNKHIAKECKRSKKCYYCSKKGHNSSLCFEKEPKESTTKKPACTSQHLCLSCTENNSTDETANSPAQFQAHLADMQNDDGIVMATVSTVASNPETGSSAQLLVYLDPGARYTCIDKAAADQLGLKPMKSVVLNTARFNTSSMEKIQAHLVELDLNGKDGFRLRLQAYAITHVAPVLPLSQVTFSRKVWGKIAHFAPKNIPPTKPTSVKIDILLGMDYWYALMGPDISKTTTVHDNLVVHCTPLGNIFAGSVLKPKGTTISTIHTMLAYGKTDLSQLWELDTIGIKKESKSASRLNEEILAAFKETTIYENKRYYVKWPWKVSNPILPTNYQTAKFRLQRTLDTLRTGQGLGSLQAYNNIIMDQLQTGVIEPVLERQPKGSLVHYISHFPHISSDRATTKVRIVYDASAKTKPTGKSLNDLIFTGINYLENLTGLLIRFRLPNIALISDIEKAFLQVGLRTEDRDCTRFLWLRDIKKNTLEDNTQAYRFTRIPFGIVASPYLLGATICHHLERNPGPTSKKVLGNIYMDNILIGASTTEEAKMLYHDCKRVFSQASMNVREWASNSKQVQAEIRPEDRAKDGDTVKVLGVLWHTNSDKIQLKYKPSTTPQCTKREILQESSKLFDPLKLFCPLTIKGKIKLQELWKENINWETPVSEKHKADWLFLKNELANAATVQLPRQLAAECNVPLQLFAFSDASPAAYAAVIYVSNHGHPCSLVFAKARVSPVKPLMTLPRLELLGALIAARALRFVQSQLQTLVERKILWVDSQIVIHWLNSSRLLDPYIQRRIDEIKSADDIEFRYVPSADNPADLATRRTGPSMFSKSGSVWFTGPVWLAQEESKWPKWEYDLPLDPSSATEKTSKSSSQAVSHQSVPEKGVPPYGIIISHYSTLKFLLLVTVYCSRFVNALKKVGERQTRLTPNPEEILDATMLWILHVQDESLSDVRNDLSHKRTTKLIRQLDLYLDNGIIRCGGRFANAMLAKDAMFPILLPKDHPFTKLVVWHFHERCLHFGAKATLTELRKHYWIPHGLLQVKKVLKNCLICRRSEGGPFKPPKMAPLPQERITRAPAFTYVGLDYMGPLYVRSQADQPYRKRWVALFTCFSTRAVHLEIVSDCTAQSAVNVFLRFISRRGTPKMILTDNAKQFQKASHVLARIWDSKVLKDIESKLAHSSITEGILWRTIPERSPWVGGFYERLIGLVKRALRKALWRTTVNDDALHTLTVEIEGVLNSRPLLSLGSSLADDTILTPAHFISPRVQLVAPPTQPQDLESSPKPVASLLTEQWSLINKRLNQFWEILQSQYFQELRQIHQTYFKQRKGEIARSPIVGEIVLIKEATPRVSWKFGRVDRLLEAADGTTRFVLLQLPKGSKVRRGVRDIVPLEANLPGSCMG